MVLISLIAIGLMGLASIELRSSSRSVAAQQARANARLALVFAIGSLQKHAGPDQRVTGPADLVAGKAGSNNPVANPNWTAVWKSVMPDGSAVIQRQGNRGGLHDRRFSEGWNAESDLLVQLISGNEDQRRFSASSDTTDPAKFELLVGEGSLGSSDQASQVRAPKVTVNDAAQTPGQYAWWVGDLGTRANVSTRDRFASKSDRFAETRRLQIAQDFSTVATAGKDTPDEVRPKILTPGEFELYAGESSGDARFHAFTTDSESVLADVREGGLKKDLTPYLLGSGSIDGLDGTEGPASLGVSDDDNLIGPPNKRAAALYPDGGEATRMADVSPSFGLLRDWAQRANSTSFTSTVANAEHPATRPLDENKMSGYLDQNQLPVQFENRTASDVAPVLVESSIYYNLSYYETDDVDPRHKIGLRLHLYPRVAIWNPYNISLKLQPSMVAMQINGAKSIEVTLSDNRKHAIRMSWGRITNANDAYSGPRRGTHYFQLAPATIEPGETIVFSPDGNRLYDLSTLSNNLLTPDAPPDPSRSFYLDKRPDNEPPNPTTGEKDVLFKVGQSFPPNPGVKHDRLPSEPVEWREIVPTKPIGNVQRSGYTQADDYYMYWKPIPPGKNAKDLATFNSLPHGRFVSCAFQYGDEDELPVQWSSRDPVPFQRTDTSAVTSQIPDRRTRDGFRLRWFREHPSNLLGSGSLQGTPHLEDAAIANWNMRASYSLRSPYENVSDVAPHYFGIYTRDLFDDAVAWTSMTPRSGAGGQLGDPFDQPLVGMRRILFDVPRTGAEVVSLGAFQHLKFSEFIWNPSYAFGNSLADPRVELTMTQPDRSLDVNSRDGGWNRDSIGYATDGRSGSGTAGVSDPENWAYHARGLLEQFARDQNMTFDLSYELNHALWDRYFLSTGTEQDKRSFIEDPDKNPLPNGRLLPRRGSPTLRDDVTDFHRAAAAMTLDGGFNVNSTQVDAWEALFLSSAGVRGDEGQVSFPRIYNLPGTADGSSATRSEAWSGQRMLNRSEVRKLAEAIVAEVRLRGPFLSLSDFVNRRLVNDVTGRMGALEAALKKSGVNDSFTSNYPLNNREELPDYNHVDNIKDPTRLEQTSKPDSSAWGALSFVTQADLLQALGPVLTARSDTFIVRSYGNALDKDGKVIAEAWCEAVVQRTPQPLSPDESGINPDTTLPVDFGRRFEVKRFRWLHRDEI